jgi:membrane associated rhomboid family serine protease
VPADAATRVDAVAKVIAAVESDYPAQLALTEKAVAVGRAGGDAEVEAEVQRSRLEAIFLPLSAWFALYPVASGNFMPWQVVTYAFLHGGMGHLFFNMLGLWMFGSELERLWGGKRYMQFLLAGVLAAAAAQLIVTFLTGSRVPTLGASGALFALLLAFGMLFPNRVIMPLFPPIPMKARTFVIVFGGIELLLGSGLVDSLLGLGGGNIAHFAHLGGMVGGWLVMRFWRGQMPFGRRR